MTPRGCGSWRRRWVGRCLRPGKSNADGAYVAAKLELDEQVMRLREDLSVPALLAERVHTFSQSPPEASEAQLPRARGVAVLQEAVKRCDAVSLRGLPGAGKATLVRQYGHEYAVVGWLRAETKEAAERDLAAMGEVLLGLRQADVDAPLCQKGRGGGAAAWRAAGAARA